MICGIKVCVRWRNWFQVCFFSTTCLTQSFSAWPSAVRSLLWSVEWIQAPCFGWASGRHQASRSFQKAFLIFLSEHGKTTAQTKHRTQSWSTSKPPLLSLFSAITPFTNPSSSNLSFPWPCIFLFYPLIIYSRSCFIPLHTPPLSSFSLLIPLLFSMCGLLLYRRSSTGNLVEQPATLIHRKGRRRKTESKREEMGLGWRVGWSNTTIIITTTILIIIIIVITVFIKPSYISNEPWMFAARNNVHLLSNLAIIQACQTTII